MSTDPTVRALNELALVACGWPEFGGEFDLLGDREPDLPEQPGVYAVLTDDGETIRYPRGRSRVIYIGCAYGSGGLRKRLGDHRSGARECRAEKEDWLYLPLYEWINSAGGIVLFSVAPGRDMTAQRMETLLLNAFKFMHYALPIANGQNGARHAAHENWPPSWKPASGI